MTEEQIYKFSKTQAGDRTLHHEIVKYEFEGLGIVEILIDEVSLSPGLNALLNDCQVGWAKIEMLYKKGTAHDQKKANAEFVRVDSKVQELLIGIFGIDQAREIFDYYGRNPIRTLVMTKDFIVNVFFPTAERLANEGAEIRRTGKIEKKPGIETMTKEELQKAVNTAAKGIFDKKRTDEEPFFSDDSMGLASAEIKEDENGNKTLSLKREGSILEDEEKCPLDETELAVLKEYQGIVSENTPTKEIPTTPTPTYPSQEGTLVMSLVIEELERVSALDMPEEMKKSLYTEIYTRYGIKQPGTA